MFSIIRILTRKESKIRTRVSGDVDLAGVDLGSRGYGSGHGGAGHEESDGGEEGGAELHFEGCLTKVRDLVGWFVCVGLVVLWWDFLVRGGGC